MRRKKSQNQAVSLTDYMLIRGKVNKLKRRLNKKCLLSDANGKEYQKIITVTLTIEKDLIVISDIKSL